MLRGHGTFRVITSELVKTAQYWRLDLELDSYYTKIDYQKKKPPETIIHRYKAYMYLTGDARLVGWEKSLVTGKIVEVAYCEIEGLQWKEDKGKWEGWHKLKLYADPKYTIPRRS